MKEEGSLIAGFFRHRSNAVLALAVAGIVLALFGQGRLIAVLPFVAVGMLVFFCVEYVSHRFLLHAAPRPEPSLSRLQRRLHYDHHKKPDILELLFVPLWFSLPNLAVYAALYYLLSGSVPVTLALLLGNLISFLYYEWVHYVAHIPATPRTPWGRWMKKYHLLHHYKNEGLWFGVTNPSLDLLCGTYRRAGLVEKSSTVRHIDSARKPL
ncbi:MAG TPA: sterol desaturase family protein [Blastocatellia bacterium]|jgi:sterol desaturase/sphingolipid hydroxylase (fatty acid hydroxylase superfamily)|nr:sterol desaturase family protein [Blastocatellia bacterium]